MFNVPVTKFGIGQVYVHRMAIETLENPDALCCRSPLIVVQVCHWIWVESDASFRVEQLAKDY